MASRDGWIIDMAAGPIFQQIAENVRRLLARGDLAPGEKLPSGRDLAAALGVNPNTVVHAFAELERMNVIESKRGLGTFVREDAPVAEMRRDMLRAAAKSFAAEVQAIGVSDQEGLAALKEVLDAGDSR
jgi:GntR family transcriptional regulator